jgi:hypothetical protein
MKAKLPGWISVTPSDLSVDQVGAGRSSRHEWARQASRSIILRVSTACFMLPVDRVRRASSGIVCAAEPSSPGSAKRSRDSRAIARARSTAGAPGSRPCGRSEIDGKVQVHVRAACLRGQLAAFCSVSTIKIVSGTSRASATARVIFGDPMMAVVAASRAVPPRRRPRPR